jgi:hypothetical protein
LHLERADIDLGVLVTFDIDASKSDAPLVCSERSNKAVITGIDSGLSGPSAMVGVRPPLFVREPRMGSAVLKSEPVNEVPDLASLVSMMLFPATSTVAVFGLVPIAGVVVLSRLSLTRSSPPVLFARILFRRVTVAIETVPFSILFPYARL